jgi:TolB-like protein/DNA-binding winged helix-turn-helix (wHTH) protein/Tfp pilus assembly protein PilF
MTRLPRGDVARLLRQFYEILLVTMNPVPDHLLETTAAAFVVGDLYLDVGQQRVTRAGSDIALPNLSFQLLLALVRAAPNVLGNESLMTQVWPGLVVSPETVNKRVNLLREALGDDPREPRYITGVRSRGYRLIASVSRATEGALLPNLPTPIPEGSPRAADLPIPVVPIETPQTDAPKSRLPWGRWAALSVLTAGLLIAATIGVRWAVRHQVEGAIPAPVAPATTTAAIGALSRTVAVLPFDSISADRADAYLAQGLPEMILNRLSRVSGLSVIARNSSFALATKSIDSREIGRRLNSGYLIGGSVQREADRLRVAVQLVDSAAGTLIWSAHFDRGLHDIFSLEDEIADQLAGALSVRLGELEPKPPPGARSANLEAYLAFLRGRTLLGRFTVAESEAAVPYFERAIALDPNFASAYASLYDARMQAADQRREDLTLARQRYRHLIDRALKLDPKLGSAYFARAMWADEPHDASAISANPLIVARERDFRQGAALDPSNGRGLGAYAEFLYWVLERPEEGRRVLKRALWVDPMSPSARFTDAEFSLDDSGAKASEQKTLQVLELDPNFVPALQRYGKFRWLIDGKLAEAIQLLEHGIALDPKNSLLLHSAMAVYLDLGDAKAARAVVAGMPPSARAVGLLAMHEGNWRRAGLSAYDEAGWTSDSDYCEIWQGEALRDYALKTGELSRAITFIKLKFYLGDAPAAHLDVCNYGAAIYLSQLLAASGQPQQALALRRAAASWNDANEAKYLGGSRRLRARVLLLDGKPDAALTELAESFRSGNYVYWWYTINYDPLWLPLHSDSRFQAIEADVRRYIDAQRSELEALRRNGLVPRRGLPTASR